MTCRQSDVLVATPLPRLLSNLLVFGSSRRPVSHRVYSGLNAQHGPFEPEQLNVLDRAFYWLSARHDVTFTQTDLDVTTYIRAEHTEEADILRGF